MSMQKELQSAIEEVLRDYPIARSTPRHTRHSVHRALGQVRDSTQRSLETCHGTQELRDRWELRASPGRGERWANVCWVTAMRTQETETARDGRYLAWLFDAQGRYVMWGLVWGTSVLRRSLVRGVDIGDALRTRRALHADWLRAHLDETVWHIDEDVDLGAGTPLARDYERSCLAWRIYAPGEDMSGVVSDVLELSGVYVGLLESASTTLC